MQTTIFDNGGTTFDRYTIITKDGEMFGASQNPFHPQGFGQYCGNVVEVMFGSGASTQKHCYNEKRGAWKTRFVSIALQKMKTDCKERGEVRVKVGSLPQDVQQYVKQLETNS